MSDAGSAFIDELGSLFVQEGARDYFGEAVTQAEHMLQAAALARAAGGAPALIAAALLHDVGHFPLRHGIGTLGGGQLMAGTDNRHSDTGATWLSRWFPPEVTEPVRLHVAAKRYLCATEPGYLAELSEASAYTLSVQGGPMDPAQCAEFAAGPYARQAVALRRWDDAAKDPGAKVPGFEHYRPILAGLLRA
jgi:gamma-butyrobetaine dioxygenase